MRVPLKELPEFAGNVLAAIWLDGEQTQATILALEGEVGSGKTTFVQTLCKRLGIKEVVQSPTYVLMKSYPLEGPLTSFGAPRRFNRLVHIDAYRLESPEEFKTLRPEEFLNDPKALVLVEWPRKLGTLLPTPNLLLRFSADGMSEDERDISMEQKQ
jgi:tRNA threonylcarbamoyladenosine biosynthesis protein TsaE